MLERVVLNQSRFRTPGVSLDGRGVLLGRKGVVLLGTLEAVVRFFGVWSRDGSLDDLVELTIRRVRTQLGGHEMTIEFEAQSSYVMDRAAAIARLLSGFTFTGTARHFVKYRDSAAPLGYDVGEILPDPGDVALYHDTFQQAYRHERELPLRDLLLRLSPSRFEEPHPPESVLVLVRKGLGPALQAYLYRSGVEASLAVVDRPARSAFSEGPERLFLFRADGVAPRILALLRAMPGVTVFVPVLPDVAVELGHRHPIQLESCARIFGDGRLTLFRGDGRPAEILDEVPAWTPLSTLARVDIQDPNVAPLEADAGPVEGVTVAVHVRLAPSSAPWTRVVATVVPSSQLGWLRKLVYALPPSSLRDFRVFVAADRVVLTNPEGVDAIPLGTFYSEYGSGIHVPAGWELLPHVAPDVLRGALGGASDVLYFFELGGSDGRPLAIRQADLVPLSRRAVLPLAATPLPAVGEPLPSLTPPEVLHKPIGVFPLWGVRGKDEPGREEE